MRRLITLFVNPVQIILVAATLLLAFGCSENDENYGTGRLMSLRWDNLPLEFSLSDASRIEVTTPSGTQLRNIGWRRLFYLDNPDEPIESVRIHFGKSGVALPVEGHYVSITDTQLSITRDFSDVTFVRNRLDLEQVRNALAGRYLQISHIDLSGENWVPIGPGRTAIFTGTYDGGGFEIRGMTVDVSTTGSVEAGLFGWNKGTLRDIHIDAESSVSATSPNGTIYIGGVCARNDSGGTIKACSNSGSVNGLRGYSVYDGGICGMNAGIITACSNSGSVSVDANNSSYCGGICGYNGNTIVSCMNSGSVAGLGIYEIFCGGICGNNLSGCTIASCGNSGYVNAGAGRFSYRGGICGNSYGKIVYCFWGGHSNDLNARGSGIGHVAHTSKYGAGAWPVETLPGWGDTAPADWDVERLGAWTNPWSSLGKWNGGSPNFPTLK